MTRKKLPLAIAALTAGMFGSGAAYALGLGDIKLYSHLNEPLQAEIGLVEVGDLNPNEIITKLAGKEAFDKAGIDRDFFLTQIKFEVVIQPDGRGVLKLSTLKSANEPYLDFILDASWPNGHVLKQYTLLLDPPTYTVEGAPPSVSKPEEATPVVVEQKSEAVVSQPDNQVPTTTPAAPAQPIIPAGTEHYTTQRNDTLWRIASTHQAAGTSAAQTMDAIHQLNPDAFIKNNRNLLKVDKTLRLPSPEEVAFLTQGGSVQQLLSAQQNARAPQLSTDQAATSAPAAASEDKLKIVGSSSTSATTGAGTSESIDKIDRDNQDMNARLTELTAQIQAMQKIIQMQDDQLSTLQQKLGGTPQKAEQLEAVEKLKSELSKVETEINKTSTTPAAGATTVPTSVPATAATTPPDQTTAPATEVAAPAAQPTAVPTQAAVATQPPAVKPTEKPVVKKPVEVATPVVPAEKESGSMWIVVLGFLIGAGAVAAVFGKKFIDKRKAQTQIETESDWSVDALRHEPSLASTMDERSEAVEVESPIKHETASEFVAPTHVEPQKTHVTHDTLEEANELVVNGNVGGAINILKEAISEQATRLDLRTRLLEISAEAGDIETFEAQESYISRWGGAAAKQLAAELRAKLASMVSSAPASIHHETALDFNIDSTSAIAKAPAEIKHEDELVSLDHLFDDTPATKPTETSVDIADDLASLDHLFDDTSASTEAAAQSEVISLPEVKEPETANVKDDLASLDHLFDDLPVEEPKKTDEISFDLSDFETTVDEPAAIEAEVQKNATQEIDFTAELGLLDEEPETTAKEPEFEIALAPEEPAAPVAEVVQEETAAIEAEAAPAQEQASAPATGGEDDEFGFLAGTDEAATKLDLAKAYIDMEDIEGAKDILQEVLQEGNAAQQQEAKDLLARL